MGPLVHTCLGSSYLIAHVLHCPPPPPAHSFIIGPAVINTHNRGGAVDFAPQKSGLGSRRSPRHACRRSGAQRRFLHADCCNSAVGARSGGAACVPGQQQCRQRAHSLLALLQRRGGGFSIGSNAGAARALEQRLKPPPRGARDWPWCPGGLGSSRVWRRWRSAVWMMSETPCSSRSLSLFKPHTLAYTHCNSETPLN